MIVYSWKCDCCGVELDVERATMKDSHVPPESCNNCDNKTRFTKLISRQGKPILKGDGWFRDTVTSTGRSNGR